MKNDHKRKWVAEEQEDVSLPPASFGMKQLVYACFAWINFRPTF